MFVLFETAAENKKCENIANLNYLVHIENSLLFGRFSKNS